MERSPSQKARDRRDGERPVWVTAAAFIVAMWGHAQLGEAWWGCRNYLRETRDEAGERIPCYHSAEIGGKLVRVLEPEWYAPWRFTNCLLRLAVGVLLIVSAVLLWKLRFYAIWMVVGGSGAAIVLFVTDAAGGRLALGPAARGWGEALVATVFYSVLIFIVLTGDRKAFYISAERSAPDDAPPGREPAAPGAPGAPGALSFDRPPAEGP